jgi:hypothetical protein
VSVTVNASDSCHPTCSSVLSTLTDTTRGWTEQVDGSSPSDFNAFVAVVGASPLLNFGKLSMSAVTLDGSRFPGKKSNLVDLTGHTLARAGAFAKARESFTVKWVRVQ